MAIKGKNLSPRILSGALESRMMITVYASQASRWLKLKERTQRKLDKKKLAEWCLVVGRFNSNERETCKYSDRNFQLRSKMDESCERMCR